MDPWKRSTAAIVAIELLSRPHRTFIYPGCGGASVFVPTPEYARRPFFRLFISNFSRAVFFFVFGVPQELVRLRGDAHRQLRDGGRGGDVHQARLPALHLGPVSSSGVSIALPIRVFFLHLRRPKGDLHPVPLPRFLSPHFRRLPSHHSIHVPTPPFFFPPLPLTLIPQNSSIFHYPGESRCRIVFGYV